MRNTKLKTFLATILVLFNLVICFTATIAWYVNQQIDDASGMQMQIYTHELDMAYRIYKYVDDEKSILDVTNRQDALTLQEYDSVIKSRNTNTPIILDFLLTGVTIGENIPIYINTHCNNSTTTDRVLSNIVQLQFCVIPNLDEESVSSIYTSVLSYIDLNNVSPVTFKQGNTKNQDVLYTLSNYANLIEYGSLRIFIKIDYSEELIDDFEFSLSDSSSTSFLNDLTLINCYTND